MDTTTFFQYTKLMTKLPKDICLLSDSFPPVIDGVANTVVNYARVLNDNGQGLNVVVPEHPQADDSGLDYPVIRYPGMDMSDKIGYVVGNPFDTPTLKLLNTMNIGLLHSHSPAIANILGMELRATLDVPLVLTYHTKFDIEIKKALKGELISSMAIDVLVDSVSACDELWVVSRGAGESLRKLGYEGDYVVMENGVDMKRHIAEPSRIRKVTAAYDLPEGVPVFLFVGRLQWYKGIRIILDALSELKATGNDFRMVFVGRGQEENEIKEYTTKQGLDDKCFFTGPLYDREDLAAWYSRADLFLFPSTFDTNGLVVREASACSLASVLVRDSCASEGITDGVDGLLIDESARSLAKCLRRIMYRPEKMKEMGRNASANLYLSWDDSVSRAVNRYAFVMDNYKRGMYSKHVRPIDGFLIFYARMLGLLGV